MKDLSILVRTYKEHPDLLNKSMSSILRQKNIEESKIIIYNDGGDKQTIDYCLDFINQNKHIDIKFVYGKNQGLNFALKELYKVAQTKYIIVFDGDDEYTIDDALYLIMKEIKSSNLDYIRCDPSEHTLHQMVIYNKYKISEDIFVGFDYAEDIYRLYIFNYLNGKYIPLNFYYYNYFTNGVHCWGFKSKEEENLNNLCKKLYLKEIDIKTAKLELKKMKSYCESNERFNMLYNNVDKLFKSKLFK